ncbi:MAG: HD domain-containing protein [Thermoplasmata archaeon]
MQKKMNVEDLVEGQNVKDKFAVRDKYSPKEYARGWFFRLKVGDSTGDIPMVYWGGSDKRMVEALYSNIKVGDVLEVDGAVTTYRGDLQISVSPDEFHKLRRTDMAAVDPSNYMPTSKRNVDEMFEELMEYGAEIQDEGLYSLVMCFLEDDIFSRKFKQSPYSKYYNNNYLGGLLEHTLDDVRLSLSALEIYPELDRDLLLTTAIVHDFGKVYEYDHFTSIDLTTESRLIGHTVLCERVVRDRSKDVNGLTEEQMLKLSHIILSHHGDYEWGSARSPRMEEAVALHHIDLFNVRMRGFIQAKEETDEGDEEMIYVSKEGVQRPIFKG